MHAHNVCNDNVYYSVCTSDYKNLNRIIMSRISRYQGSISKFLITKSCFAKTIKDNKIFDDIMNTTDHLAPVILLTVLNNQYKKKNFKTHHGYYMASGIDVLMTVANIFDNETYYKTKFGVKPINDFISEMPFYVFKCLSQNIETLESLVNKDDIIKMYHQAINQLQNKISKIVQRNELTGTTAVKKTDIVKFHFSNKQLIQTKYKKLKKIDRDILIAHVDQKYGLVCQIAFIMGWLLGMGDEKMLTNLERLGTHMGLMFKISNDFNTLERDITHSDKVSYNLIVNYGIHECFSLFMESKIKLLNGCLSMNIFSNTMKEIVDHIEKQFDNCLKNTDIELNSVYSSFTDGSKAPPKKDSDDDSDDAE